MTKLAFLLDSNSCIGCHACTVACKSEHDVPLGVNRTWVKYVETGTFPDVDRHFSVMRCNQCADAPCMKICPTDALFRATNGVVDFDDSDCIGCKSCMNACPYDSIYLNPVTNTAHKCNFCNHRIADGLEPSCVVVCPTHAIKVADLDDPLDPVTAVLDGADIKVRSPEQGTEPNVYYRGGHPASLDPLRSAIADDGMIWIDTLPSHPTSTADFGGVDARTVHTTAHPMVWKAKVSGYLVTKAVAAGVILVAALLVVMGHSHSQAAVGVMPPVGAGIFLAVTGVLLIADLKQPSRFHYLITRGSWESWLVKGAYILTGFAASLVVWAVGGFTDTALVIEVVSVPGALLAVATAGYTAFLFGQCEGRDFWQGRLLLPTLITQSIAAGGATYCILDLFMVVPEPTAVRWVVVGGVLGTASLVAWEVGAGHTRHVAAAVHQMVHGPYRHRFRFGVIVGLAAPAVLVAITLALDLGPALPAVAGVGVLAGLWSYEDAFVRAGQSVPLS